MGTDVTERESVEPNHTELYKKKTSKRQPFESEPKPKVLFLEPRTTSTENSLKSTHDFLKNLANKWRNKNICVNCMFIAKFGQTPTCLYQKNCKILFSLPSTVLHPMRHPDLFQDH